MLGGGSGGEIVDLSTPTAIARATARTLRGSGSIEEAGLCVPGNRDAEGTDHPASLWVAEFRQGAEQAQQLCFSCPALLSCQSRAEGHRWTSVVVGGWVAPSNGRSAYGEFPPWSVDEDPEPSTLSVWYATLTALATGAPLPAPKRRRGPSRPKTTEPAPAEEAQDDEAAA